MAPHSVYCQFQGKYHHIDLAMHLAMVIIEGILPKRPHPPCLRMADRALLAGCPRYMVHIDGVGGISNIHPPIDISRYSTHRGKDEMAKLLTTYSNAFS